MFIVSGGLTASQPGGVAMVNGREGFSLLLEVLQGEGTLDPSRFTPI